MLPLLQRLTSPPKQTLTVVQPTPSTVCFTVSTRSVPRTLSAQLRHHVGHVLRVVIGILALVVVFLKWETTAARPWLVNADAGGSDEWVVYALLRELSWRYILPSVAIILYLVLRRGYTGTPTSDHLTYFIFHPNAHIFQQKNPSSSSAGSDSKPRLPRPRTCIPQPHASFLRLASRISLSTRPSRGSK
jgi:hypothetical protein